jgi:hypothetical protein
MSASGKSPEEATLTGEAHDILCHQYGSSVAVHDIENGCNCGVIFVARDNEIRRIIDMLQEKLERYNKVGYMASDHYKSQFKKGE